MPTISHPKAFSQTPAFFASGMLGISRSMYTSLHKLKPLQTQKLKPLQTPTPVLTLKPSSSKPLQTPTPVLTLKPTRLHTPKQVPLVSWALSEVGPFFLVLARPSGKKSLPNNFFYYFSQSDDSASLNQTKNQIHFGKLRLFRSKLIALGVISQVHIIILEMVLDNNCNQVNSSPLRMTIKSQI